MGEYVDAFLEALFGLVIAGIISFVIGVAVAIFSGAFWLGALTTLFIFISVAVYILKPEKKNG